MPRFFLRDATRAHHHDLDTLISQFDLATIAGYRAFLDVHARALPPLEHAVEQAGIDAVFPDWELHRRSDALAADLAAAGVAPPSVEEVPTVSGTPTLFGILYVLEGSRLGGKLLAKAAASQPADQRNFLLHGQDARLWQSFLQQLETLPDDETTREGLAAGARLAFEIYMRAARSVIAKNPAQRIAD